MGGQATEIRSAGVGNTIELWGGHECTVNRVQDQWFDQTLRSGHEDRLSDLALFAGVGIRRLRYPALWERISPSHPDERDFAWTDARLAEVRRLGMEPILTLCHHGSGPRYTSLLDPSFAPGLARHAAAVAERYPWITDYTPVNEPLTTARFSALYGFWYPHQRDEGVFWLALLNEIDATRLAMRAIRRVNPAARLIQTDDLGYCHATPPLQYEADFQNERRWMGWDLLCGRVTPGHALWDRLSAYGLADRLRAIADDPCPPAVVGINHYLSSERLLDHRIHLHGGRSLADRSVGDSAGTALVDVDAVRNAPERVIGLSGLIEQAWDRYRLPIAVTECHNGSTREEQSRWFVDAWRTLEALRPRGVDVRALTAWSLLGSYDWNRLVTTADGHYEPGVFDVRADPPRPTMMARVARALAHGRTPEEPGLDVPGWWREERRALLGANGGTFALELGPRAHPAPRPLAILTGDAMITRLVTGACEARGLHYLLVRDADQHRLRAADPWALFDARAGLDTREPVAALCRDLGIVGASIRAADGADDRDGDDHMLLVRTGPVFTCDEDHVEALLLDEIDAGRGVEVDGYLVWEGVYGPALVDGVLDLLLDGATGCAHFVVERGWTLADFARALASVGGCEAGLVREAPVNPMTREGGFPVPSYLPSLESVLERFVGDRRRHRSACGEEPGAEAAE